MNLLKWRNLSTAELAKEAARPFRFEVWREEPNAKDRPYRRQTDRYTHMVWHNLADDPTWSAVIALVKPHQNLRVSTFLRRGFSCGSIRYVSVRIVNRKPKQRPSRMTKPTKRKRQVKLGTRKR